MMLFLVAALVFIVASAHIIPAKDSSLKNGDVFEVSKGWIQILPGGTRVPFDSFGTTIRQKSITIVHDLDTLPQDTTSVGVYNYYSAITMSVDGEEIYSYGDLSDISSGVLLGNYYSIVPVEGRGEELSITFESNEPQVIYPLFAGRGPALEMSMIREYLPALILPLLAILFLIISIILKKEKTTRDLLTEKHRWLLVFIAGISAWGIADSQLLMDLGFKAGKVCLISFELYMLLPIPLLMFIMHSCRKYRRLDLFVCNLVTVNFAVLNVLNFTGVCSFVNSLLSTHFCVALSLLLSLVQVISENTKRKKTETAYLAIGYSVFFVSVVAQYVLFFHNSSGSNTMILEMGAVAFAVLQIVGVLHEVNGRISAVTSQLEKRNLLIRKAFGSFIPDELVQSIIESPEEIGLSGGTRELTLLSSDIRGFTELIQTMTAQSAIGMLNHYLEAMTTIIDRYGGTIMEFIGDGIVATFTSEDHADKALFTAVCMQNCMEDVNRWNKKHGYPEFEIGIGLHTGTAYMGYIGSKARFKYDAIGSNVNFVSRVESYSTGGQIIISQDTYRAATVDVRVGDSFRVLPKGYKKEETLYSVDGIGEPYNFICQTNLNRPVSLPEPVEILFKTVVDAHCSEEVYEGKVVAVSDGFATLVSQLSMKLFDDIRIVSPGLVSGKVVSRSQNGYLIRFTSAPKFQNEWSRINQRRSEENGSR